MKYDKVLQTSGGLIQLVSDSMTQELGTPGRGIFAVRSTTPIAGIVKLAAGLNGNYEIVFTGYVETCRQIDAKQQRLTVRECGAVLARRWPMAFRNTQVMAILNYLSTKTGLAFDLGKAAASSAFIGMTSLPYFVNIGSGYEALDLLGKELAIEDYLWQCQPDGSIYIGSRAGMKAYQTPLAIPSEFFTDLSAAGAGCPYIPGFRPGRRLRIGNSEDLVVIEKITVSAESMRLNFEG